MERIDGSSLVANIMCFAHWKALKKLMMWYFMMQLSWSTKHLQFSLTTFLLFLRADLNLYDMCRTLDFTIFTCQHVATSKWSIREDRVPENRCLWLFQVIFTIIWKNIGTPWAKKEVWAKRCTILQNIANFAHGHRASFQKTRRN